MPYAKERRFLWAEKEKEERFMKRDDVLKLKAVVLYVMNKCRSIDFVHLFKIIYFAEREQYANYGQHLVADKFCALEHGPVPDYLYNALKAVTQTGVSAPRENMEILTSAIKPCKGEAYYMVKACEAPDMDELSDAEISALDRSYAENIKKTVDEISEDSHDEAWRTAWNTRKYSEMDSVLIAKAGGASQGFASYIRESEILDKMIAG